MINKEQIVNISNKILSLEIDKFQDSDIFFVDAKVSNDNRITVFIDSFNGAKVADCAMLSKNIEEKLDRENEDFELVVSSAGIDKPFKVLKQYKKNIGKTVEVQTAEGDKHIGELIKVSDSEFTIKPNNKKVKKKAETELEKEQIFKFEHIKQVKVIITF
ncbi:MAG: ribosome assembly cofactor RimP [Bacteroidales bacterium]|nr:ribosome assembly cofactor RimP [Bacteroidales bacterium]